MLRSGRRTAVRLFDPRLASSDPNACREHSQCLRTIRTPGCRVRSGAGSLPCAGGGRLGVVRCHHARRMVHVDPRSPLSHWGSNVLPGTPQCCHGPHLRRGRVRRLTRHGCRGYDGPACYRFQPESGSDAPGDGHGLDFRRGGDSCGLRCGHGQASPLAWPATRGSGRTSAGVHQPAAAPVRRCQRITPAVHAAAAWSPSASTQTAAANGKSSHVLPSRTRPALRPLQRDNPCLEAIDGLQAVQVVCRDADYVEPVVERGPDVLDEGAAGTGLVGQQRATVQAEIVDVGEPSVPGRLAEQDYRAVLARSAGRRAFWREDAPARMMYGSEDVWLK